RVPAAARPRPPAAAPRYEIRGAYGRAVGHDRPDARTDARGGRLRRSAMEAVQTTTADTSEAKRDSRALRLMLMRLGLLITILLAWELASGRLVAEFFISRPSAIFGTLYEWIAGGSLFYHAAITATEAFLGFLIGGAIGMSVGVLLGRAQFLAEL